ncbi:hypothetical protein [Pelosinus sp. sgz500959]|uniref:hypothetical protein n=1 Tax=Pelosinus sp. sgz500959 TaxID=3242472 RepID=UPI00366F7987
MAGKIKVMCDKIIAQRANGNPVVEKLTKTKLVLKGINPEQFTASSPDDPLIIAKLVQIGKDLGVAL